ncbi:hypothetical protein [Acidovorax cavernicola]|uniref:hypothetical protein n=1 Tax=Acidovorax cavernicola TaxID=1675792 RepID=UPI0011C43AF6|nr:hypothetical protein [Acidovorax cavernicola]
MIMALLALISGLRYSEKLDGGQFGAKFFAALIVPVFFSVVGYYLAKVKGKYFYLGSFIAVFVFVGGALYSNFESLSKGDVFRPAYYRSEDSYLLDMHFFADYFTCLALIFIGQARRRCYLFFLLALIGALLLGSRTPLVFGVVSLLAARYYLSLLKNRGGALLLAFVTVGIAIFAFVALSHFSLESGSVLERVFSPQTYGESQEGRQQILERSVPYFDQCLILGCFPFEEIFLGEKGEYVHNWISFFASFGFVAGVYFIFVYLVAVLKTFKSVENLSVLLAVLVFLTMNIVFSRSYIWSFWGMLLVYILASRPAVARELSQ